MQPGIETPRQSRRKVWLTALLIVLVLGGIGGGAFAIIHHEQDNQHQQDLRAGHWIKLATAAPGQPTPAVPPGAFIFKDVGGNPIIYFPPVNAPSAMTWKIFGDSVHGYQLNIPANWTQIEQVATLPGTHMVCPPGADIQFDAPGAPQCVIYGWIPLFNLPSPSDPTVSELRSISVGDVSGTLFTESALGTSITAVFPDKGGYVLITTYSDSDALMYTFTHILSSLTFA